MIPNILFKSGFIVLLNFILLIGCGGDADNLSEGMKAPDFTLKDANGNEITLSSFENKMPVVLYFYPKAGTPGCTTEACGIRDNFSRFEQNNIEVIGVSVDSRDALKDFIADNNLNFTLLSDDNKEVSKKYGVLNKLGLSSRITFIIDKKGIIRKIIRDVDVSTHADEVFQIAIALK